MNLSCIRNVMVRLIFIFLYSSICLAANEYELEFQSKQELAQEKFNIFINAVNEFNNNKTIVLKNKANIAGAVYNGVRHPLIFKYAWAIPNQEALNTIKEYSPIIEIGAGSGYWAYLLKNIDTDILLVDNYSDKGTSYEFTKYWLKPIKGDESMIDSYPERTLFLCWPDPRTSVASSSIKRYKGKYLIYVGYDRTPIMGNIDFFNMLEKEFKKIKEVKIPTWPGNEDYLAVYERLN